MNTIVQLSRPTSGGLIASASRLRKPVLIGSEGKMSQTQIEPLREKLSEQLPNFPKPVALAQRELAAFLNAVVSLFGSEQAKLAADVWIAELMSVDNVIGFSSRDWRLITVAAVSRLASHLINIRSGSDFAHCRGSCDNTPDRHIN